MGEFDAMKLEKTQLVVDDKYKLKYMKYYAELIKTEKLKSSVIAGSRKACLKIWMIRVASVALVFACAIQLAAMGETWSPRVLVQIYPKTPSSSPLPPPQTNETRTQPYYHNNGYLLVSSNGGLNQMRSGICDMVTIARYLNVTLIVPELDRTSFWHDQSQFQDIFDADYFIESLHDEVRILKKLPHDMKRIVDANQSLTMPPRSWSNMTYYYNSILPRFNKYTVVHFQKTDCRLANNEIPVEVQKFRCKVNYQSMRFVPEIEKLGQKIISILKEKGKFLVLHLRYEMDMLAFSGCIQGLNKTEVNELTAMRYAYPWWKQKVINSTRKRVTGSCPLTPDEAALTLKALDIDPSIQIYIAAGDIYGGERRLAGLREAYPNLVKKETLLPPSDLLPFQNHSSRMAALDYMVSLESDTFIATYAGNMAKLVEGHRRYKGFRKTIDLNKVELVKLINRYQNGSVSWDDFSTLVKKAHAGRMGTPTRRLVIPGKPKEEDYFYSNPQECLPHFDPS